MNFDYLIVGAGFTGATLAERLASQKNRKVLVIDRRTHIAGNAFDQYNAEHILYHVYGPHIFHTNSEKIWTYLSQFTEWRPYHHEVTGYVDGQYIPIPFNLNSLYSVFPKSVAQKLEETLVSTYGFGKKITILEMKENNNEDLNFLAQYIYEKVFLNYTLKQWGLKPEDLDASVTGRVPVYISRDNRYFQDKYQAMPKYGYTKMFQNMLNHKNIKVLLNTSFQDVQDDIQAKKIIFTGPIDEFFNFKHGALPYRSLNFSYETQHGDKILISGTVNYPNDHDYTRITEQKYLTGQKSDHTTLIAEYPQAYEYGRNEPYYPIPRAENRELLEKYLKEAQALEDKVIFVGRLADYKYYNMDQACARALSVFEKLIGKNG